ncbi:pentatricopeptide repeat-containing protein At4g01400, mitochondrial [Quercus robur]|uniref:pentatricopeptide repeat-containing protein At4g01400, mitochondrial n=1 Tax=Quercus robur TaxID=38942 RepID=UPI0021636163|nr:pentatricopeptide repeat-containing protein At4g01400, mitochondrial [Quercus robur]XP_050280711.1 pentatricopeptide repeat-containing protein At4g01400, mitochondrial [Quercus robur]
MSNSGFKMKITKMNRAPLALSFLLTCSNSTVNSRTMTHSFYSSLPQHPHQNQKQQQKQHLNSNTPIGLSPSRVQKLIASQTDPLLAKEIFDYASNQPNFRHSYSSYLTLILKLGRSNYFSLIDNLLISLKIHHYSLPPSLFSHLIKLYGNANLPNKALKTFYTIMEFNCRPSVKHLNCILEILVSHRNYVRPAFQLFRNAHCYGVEPNTKSYNTLMRAFCFCGDLSIAYQLFNEMFKRDVVPDVESYRILMQGLCRKSQVNKAVDLLEDMLNKGFVPDTLSYTTLLNSLCRKKQLREAYKLLCRMKVKGCNPDIVHYNTVILGFCREGRSVDACKVLEDMASNGCLPNLVSYRTLVNGLCDQGMFDEAKNYTEEMISKGFSPHFSAVHALVKGFCNVGRIEEACGVLGEVLKHGEAPHVDTWMMIIPRICEMDETVRTKEVLEEVLKIEVKHDTRIVEAGVGLEDYLIRKIRAKQWRG